jgi:cyclic-di-GMP-binding protein
VIRHVFSFIKSRKANRDPLSDLRTISRWMQELPLGDVSTAQEQVVQKLIQFNHAKLPVSAERLEVLAHLDEAARNVQDTLCSQYLRNLRMPTAVESRLWRAIHAFYWEVTRGYHACLMDYLSNPAASRIQGSIPLVTARAVRGFADLFKWRYFRGEGVEAKLWLKMHNLLLVSEYDHFEHAELKLYDHDVGKSSVAEEYIQALLLSLMTSGALTPRQIEMVDRWLDNWSRLLRLDNVKPAECDAFQVNTGQGRGLQRVLGGCDQTCRFLCPDPVIKKVEMVRRALKTGTPPVSLGLGEDFRLPEGYELLDIVAGEWSNAGPRERRASPRLAASGRWQVLLGLDAICSQLESELADVAGEHPSLNQEELLDIRLYGFVRERTQIAVERQSRPRPSPESELIRQWAARDHSEVGQGFVIRNDESEWAKLGTLVALRAGPQAPWQIGVVRRTAPWDETWRVVGIKTVTGPAEPVHIEPEITPGLSYSVYDTYLSDQVKAWPALHFRKNDSGFLIADPAAYASGRAWRLSTRDGVERIRLDAVRDKGEGWVLAGYFTEP